MAPTVAEVVAWATVVGLCVLCIYLAFNPPKGPGPA